MGILFLVKQELSVFDMKSLYFLEKRAIALQVMFSKFGNLYGGVCIFFRYLTSTILSLEL